MSLADLHIQNLRNINSTRLSLNHQYNFFVGPNGSGKTSLLESVYLLSTGHSFKTREISPLVSDGENALTVFARTALQETVSIQKSLSGPTQVRLNAQPCYSSSELALFLPCQVFYQDIFQIIDAGPSVRRSLLDWGLFHVKQSYHSLWKDYKRVVKQRNALLKQKASYHQCEPWDTMLVSLAEELHQLRHDYFIRWEQCFQAFIVQLTGIQCTMHYFKGWDKKNTGKSLKDILSEQFVMDVQRQYTQSGVHQADIYITSNDLKVKQTLSRGQQKIILIAMKLAQASLLDKPCVYLFDDLASELDDTHMQRLIACLLLLKGQFFITSVDTYKFDLLRSSKSVSEFEVNNGKIKTVSRETS